MVGFNDNMEYFGSILGKGRLTTRQISLSQFNKMNINKVSIDMTKNGSIMRRENLEQPSQNNNTQNISNSVADIMGILNKAIGQLGNLSSNSNPVNTTNNQATINNSSGGEPSVSDNGASFTGLAQDVNTSNTSKGVDMSEINAMSASLNRNSNITTNDLTEMKDNLLSKKVDLASNLLRAQADYSNIQSQMQTAESNVTKLEGAIGTEETARDGAKKDLDNNTSNLNSSIKARDSLDDQLSAVDEQYKSDCEVVKTKEQEKTIAQNEVSTARTAKSKAEADVTSATQALTSAQNTLSSTPETLSDGSPNPQYEVAQAAVKEAEQQKEQADKALQEANKSLEAAEQKLETTEQGLQQAQEAKQSTLTNLQKTDSQYKDMAKKCEQMQETVEKNQDAYDNSLETYDETNSNYERLNSELESQQGIINQLGVYETKVENLQTASEKVNQLEASINQKMQTAQNSENSENSNFEDVKKDLLTNASKSEGCSANKSILENLVAAKDYDLSKCTGDLWDTHLNVAYGSAAEFESQGYIKNSDGSFTDPRTGVTMINVLGNDYTWISQEGLAGAGEVSEFGSKALAGRDYPGLFDAIERNQRQMDANISFDGFDESGNPIIRRSKTRLDLGNTNSMYL